MRVCEVCGTKSRSCFQKNICTKYKQQPCGVSCFIRWFDGWNVRRGSQCSGGWFSNDVTVEMQFRALEYFKNNLRQWFLKNNFIWHHLQINPNPQCTIGACRNNIIHHALVVDIVMHAESLHQVESFCFTFDVLSPLSPQSQITFFQVFCFLFGIPWPRTKNCHNNRSR